MGLQVDKHLKLEQPMGIDLKSIDTCLSKATKLALDVIRANEITIENSKTGKATALVAILKVFRDKSNSQNSKLLIKPNKRLNLKKKDPNQSKKHLNGLSKPISDVRERLIVKKKLWALLNTGLSGVLLFIKKGFKSTYQLQRGLCHNCRALLMASFKLKRRVQLTSPLWRIPLASQYV
jgi:hypothetical protein